VASEFITHFESLFDDRAGRVVNEGEPGGRDRASVGVFERTGDLLDFVSGVGIDLKFRKFSRVREEIRRCRIRAKVVYWMSVVEFLKICKERGGL
jgi:hypothetical protein